MKSQVSGPLLARSLRYAIERKRIESERDRLIQELQEALAKVKLLSGMLPICAWCKKVRDDQELLAGGRMLRRVALRGPFYARHLPALPGEGEAAIEK